MQNYQKQIKQLMEQIEHIIVGKHEQLELLITALLAGGHVLLEDTPGTGKTLLAKTLAASIGGDFRRIQFTPDLLPADVTGTNIFNRKEQAFTFIPGPVFCHVLLADEINRATPRTQSSLLEAMEERQVTTDGVTRPLPNPFFLIATQNPIETAGTFPLPEAQLDRFILKLSLGFPTPEEELSILERQPGKQSVSELSPVCTPTELQDLQRAATQIYVHDDIRRYIVSVVCATRHHNRIALGINPRGTLGLMHCAQAYALLHGRSYVVPEDVRTLIKPCLSHRLLFFRHANDQAVADELLDEITEQIPVPTEDFSK